LVPAEPVNCPITSRGRGVLVHVTHGTGERKQVSKGGFRTREEAEAARAEALAELRNGTFVQPEKLTVAQFLVDEWLPTQRPPTLEESTYRSYERNILLHVVPTIGGIPLQKLTPMDLNALYRELLDSGGCSPGSPKRRHDPKLVALVDKLRGTGLTWQAVADEVGVHFPDQSDIMKHAVAALWRRHQQRPEPASSAPPGPLADDSPLHPHDHPRRAEGRDALEPSRAQRRRRVQPAR